METVFDIDGYINQLISWSVNPGRHKGNNDDGKEDEEDEEDEDWGNVDEELDFLVHRKQALPEPQRQVPYRVRKPRRR